MCGRYSLLCIDDLGNRFRVFDPKIGIRSRFNIAPGSENPVIVQGGRPSLAVMQWGLVPGWTKDLRAAHHVINAPGRRLFWRSRRSGTL